MTRGAVRGMLALALVATLVVAFLLPAEEGVAVTTGKRHPATARPPATAAVTQVEAAGRGAATTDVAVLTLRTRLHDDGETMAEVFATTRWETPAEPAPEPEPEPEPPEPEAAPVQAPPLPFRAMGRYVVDGQLAVFVQHGERNLVVRVGDTIAGQYKVERFEGGSLILRYLPLGQEQSLEVGGSS